LSNNSKRKEQKIPVGKLGIIATEGSEDLAMLVDRYLVAWRKDHFVDPDEISYTGYAKDSFIIKAECPRFSNGESKAIIYETVRGYDIYIISDIGNYSRTYKMFGKDCPMSPDDHYQNIKRVISAIAGKARRINVIMPLLYEGRQHKRISRESLDCAMALTELERLGVSNILTFDAHDPRVQNAIPLTGFESIVPSYQIIKKLLNDNPGLNLSKEKMIVISPDEGGISKNIFYSQMLGLDLGLFYKRRDYSEIVGGRNPIISHEYLGDDVEGKDVLIVDDVLASGDTLLDLALELKKRKAGKIYLAVTFALFTEGVGRYEEFYRKGMFTKLYATNLTYRSNELLEQEWFGEVDMSKFIALIVDTLNLDDSLASLLDPSQKIHALVQKYMQRDD
jgi:ribose-phosphate pyrophosphokinase